MKSDGWYLLSSRWLLNFPRNFNYLFPVPFCESY